MKSMTIHKVVVARMKKLGYTTYKMGEILRENGICSATCFYNFYRGQSHIGSDKLEYIFRILGLDVEAKPE